MGEATGAVICSIAGTLLANIASSLPQEVGCGTEWKPIVLGIFVEVDRRRFGSAADD